MSEQTSFDFALDTDIAISASELDYIEAKYQAENTKDGVSEKTHFMYAWALIRSPYKADRLQGISEFKKLCESHPDRLREYKYYLAVGYFKVSMFKDALRCTDELIELEPHNNQFLNLKEKISAKLQKDSIIGLALLGAGAALAVGIAASLFRHRK